MHISKKNSLKNLARHYIIGATILFSASALHAQEINFKNEAADTTRITQILIDECGARDAGNIVRIATKFIGTPYKAATLEGNDTESLVVNLDEFDCTTFVETVLALAYTARENRSSWHDYIYNLRRIRYRNGEVNGYSSRLHYMSEWILYNTSSGMIKEITGDINNARYNVKSLNYMTSHRDAYPALADSTNYANMKNVEAGLSNHRYPFIKSSAAKNKNLASVVRSGDVVMFTTATKGLDVTHMGIIQMQDDKAMVIHASSKENKVVLDKLSLEEYLARYRNEGIRIVRLTYE